MQPTQLSNYFTISLNSNEKKLSSQNEILSPTFIEIEFLNVWFYKIIYPKESTKHIFSTLKIFTLIYVTLCRG